MKTTKMSLANMQGKLSRTEMKNIMAGSGTTPGCYGGCDNDLQCKVNVGPCRRCVDYNCAGKWCME